jgi:RND superfamily putative drug exporter
VNTSRPVFKEITVIRLARLSLRHPVASLLTLGAIGLVLSLVGLGVKSSLSPTITVVPGTEASRAQHYTDQHFGPSVLVPILLEGPAPQLDRQGPALVRDLARRPGTRVLSAWDAGPAGVQLRPRQNAAMIVASVAKSEKDMVKSGQAAIERVVARDISGPVHASVTSQAAVDRAMSTAAIDQTRARMAIALPILFVVLLLLFRAPVAALLVTVMAGTTAYTSLGMTALVAKVVDIDPIGVLGGMMAGLAIGVAFGVLFYRRWRRELRDDVAHHDAAHAAAAAIETSGRALLIGGTALVTALIVADLLGPTKVLTSIGFTTTTSGFLAMGIAVVAMPAALVLLGERAQAFSFGIPRFVERPWSALTRQDRSVVAHAVPMGALATALLLVLAIPLTAIDTGPPSAKFLPKGNPARASYERIAQVMGPGWPTPYNMVFVSKTRPITDKQLLRKFDRFQAGLIRDRRIVSVVGPGQLADTSQQLNALPAGLKDSAKMLKGGKKQLGILSNGLGQAAAGAATLRSGLSQAASGANAGASGASQIHAGLGQARSGAASVTANLNKALDAARKLRDGAAQALAGSKKIASNLGTAAKAGQAGAPIVSQMAANVNTSSDAVKNAVGATSALNQQLATAAAEIAKLPDGPAKTAAAGAIASAASAGGGLESSLSATSTTLSGAAGVASAVSTQIGQLSTGLGQLYAGSNELSSGIAKLSAGNAALASGIDEFAAKSPELTAGIAKLEAGAGQLETGLGQLGGGLSGGVGPAGTLASGLGGAQSKVAKFRSTLPSPKDIQKLQAQSPGLFNSGYFVLAAVAGARPADVNQASFIVDVKNGGDAAMITVISRYAADDPRSRTLGEDLAGRVDGFAHANDLQGAIGGQAGALGDFRSEAASRIWPVVIGISVIVTLMLMAMLRTVVLPVVAVAFDLLTAAATFGVVSLLFSGDNPAFGGVGYVDPMTIIATFALIFGVTILYEVMLLARPREAFIATGDATRALRTGLSRTAAAATGAAIAMLAVVVPFATSTVINVRQIGVAVAVAVILDALIVRPVLLPAAVQVLGRWCWWPTHSKAAPPPTPTTNGRSAIRPRPVIGGRA